MMSQLSVDAIYQIKKLFDSLEVPQLLGSDNDGCFGSSEFSSQVF